MKKVIAVIGVVALLAGNSFAQNDVKRAETAPAKKAEFRKERQHQMLESIPDLTDKQKEQIRSINAESRKSVEPQHKEVRELHNKLTELKRAENPDQKEINVLIDKTSRLDAEIAKSKAAAEVKTRKILTPEQLKVLDAKQKENMEMREKRQEERKDMRNAK